MLGIMFKPLLTGSFIVLILSGCAIEPSRRAQTVLAAYPEMVSDCIFLGGVTGTSDFSYTYIGSKLSKFRALDEAAELGATHIVWTEHEAHLRPVAQGRAYDCRTHL